MSSTPILVPLLNANEPEARLISIHVREGQLVQQGDLLFTIETTKAASDVESPHSGHLRLVAHEGETLAVGAVLGFLTATPDEAIELPAVNTEASPPQPDADLTSLRITRPARELAQTLGVDLAGLPRDRLITETIIRQFAPASPLSAANRIDARILVYGAGGHAKAIMEMLLAVGAYRIAGIIDDNPLLSGTSVLGIPVLGTRQLLPDLYQQGIRLAANGVGGIINIGIRIRLFEMLTGHGFAFPAICHPRATIEQSAVLGDGVQVFANAYVGSSVVLNEKCMVNTGAIISHDCEIGSYTHIAPGAMLAGHVHVGEGALVGMGVTTTIGLRIGSGARIGNGATLLSDVPEHAIIPAGKVWTAS